MPRHLWHRHALGQSQDLGIEIEVPLRSAVAAMDLQQLALPDQVADRHRLDLDRLRLAAAPRLVAVSLQLDQLGEPRDQLGDTPRLVIAQAGVGDRYGAIRLAVDMRKDNAIGIDHTVSAGDRFDSPGFGKAAGWHGRG